MSTRPRRRRRRRASRWRWTHVKNASHDILGFINLLSICFHFALGAFRNALFARRLGRRFASVSTQAMSDRDWIFFHFDLLLFFFALPSFRLDTKSGFHFSLASPSSQAKKKIENFKTQFSTINFNKRSFPSPTALCTELSPSSSDVFAAAMNGLRWSVREVENYRENYFAMLLDEGENFLVGRRKKKNFTETNLRVNATIEREILRMRADFQEFSNFFFFVLFELKIENIFHKLFPMLARKTNWRDFSETTSLSELASWSDDARGIFPAKRWHHSTNCLRWHVQSFIFDPTIFSDI